MPPLGRVALESPQRPAASRFEHGGQRRVWRLSVPRVAGLARRVALQGLRGGRPALGRTRATAVGARGRVRAGARAVVWPPGVVVHSRQRAAPTPLPWCIAVSGEGAQLRPLGPWSLSAAGSAWPPLVPEPGGRRDGLQRLGRWVMNGAGRAQRRPLVTAAEEAGLGGEGSAVPLWWRKVDPTRGPAAGKPRCQVACGRPLAPSGSLGAASPPLRRS